MIDELIRILSASPLGVNWVPVKFELSAIIVMKISRRMPRRSMSSLFQITGERKRGLERRSFRDKLRGSAREDDYHVPG